MARIAHFPRRPPGAEETCSLAECWAWSGMGVSRPVLGAGARFSVHRPRPAPGGHSLVELAVGSGLERSNAVEAGWRVSPPLQGDGLPRLFVHRWIDGGPCWSDCGWREWSPRWAPGDALEMLEGKEVALGIALFQGRWWVWFDGEWLGYFETKDWGGRLDEGATAQWFGEVFAPSAPVSGEMGNGRRGDDPDAARVEEICQILPSTWVCRRVTSAFPHTSDATRYPLRPAGEDGFRYGGPGEPPAVTPRPPPSSASEGTPRATGRSATSPRG
jgi:hypothetical protein